MIPIESSLLIISLYFKSNTKYYECHLKSNFCIHKCLKILFCYANSILTCLLKYLFNYFLAETYLYFRTYSFEISFGDATFVMPVQKFKDPT